MINEEKRVIVYCRESRDNYKENYERIETQRDILLNFCKSKKLNNIIKIVMDDDKSGTDFERFNEIKNMAKKKEFDIIVFKNSSRIGRNQIESLKLVSYLESHDIEILFEDEKYDEELFGLYAWFNERRARDDSKNIRRNLRHKMEEGKLIVKPIYGYEKVDKKLIVNNKTAKIVRKIFSLYISGNGYSEIAKYLNKKEVPTPSESRGYSNCKVTHKWNRQHIERILKDVRYTGTYVGGRTEKINFKSKKIRIKNKDDWFMLENNHEAIVSKTIFDKANK
ncbi:MAG: recombinase family protein [Clostridia bacterium]|nr:recombinase family protein [Clostridia bacterium]